MVEVSILIPYSYREDQLLLWMQQRLTKDELHGLWEFPGGKVESQESFLQAVLREVKEETGITLPRERMIHFYDTEVTYGNKVVALHCFSIEDRGEFPEGDGWMTLQQFQRDETPIPAINRKIVEHLISCLKVN